MINIPDAYKDHLLQPEYRQADELYHEKHLVPPRLAPIMERRKRQGARQLINKNSGAPFTVEDEKLLAAFLSIVGEILKRLTMSKSPRRRSTPWTTMDDADLVSSFGGRRQLDAFDEDEAGPTRATRRLVGLFFFFWRVQASVPRP